MAEPQRDPRCDHDAIRAGTAGIDAIDVQPGGPDPDLALYNCPGCGTTIAREVPQDDGMLEVVRMLAGAPPDGWPRLELPKDPGVVSLAGDVEVVGTELQAFLEAGGGIQPNGYRLVISGTFTLTEQTIGRIALSKPEEVV